MSFAMQLTQPRVVEPPARNEFQVLYVLFACGCCQRIRFPDLGLERCPRHGHEKVAFTRHAPGTAEHPA